MKYEPSLEYLQSKNLPFSGKLSVQKIDYNPSFLNKMQAECGWVETYTRRNCTVHGYNGVYVPECNNYGKDSFAYSSSFVCFSGGGGSGTSFESGDTPSGGGGDGSQGSSNTSPVYPCEDPIHGCDKIERQIADRLNVDSTLLDNLSESILNDLDEIATIKENVSVTIYSPNFDGLNNPWLKALRAYAKKLEQLKDKISKPLWDAMNQYLDNLLINALTKTAFKFNPDADTTKESNKQNEFQNNGEKGIGILLYEFANGEGLDAREFTDGDFWNQFFEGDRKDKIKVDFENILTKNNLTFNQFVANGNMLPSSYKFSPDHAGVLESFEEHKNANWVQFFVGGSRVEYRASSQNGYIDVKLINPTSRKSLLLHIGDNYDRHPQETIPLSTIEQYFYIKLKIY
jgi:hypothetical protein